VLPSGVTATPMGKLPTVIVAVTAFVAVLITDTDASPTFVIYAFWAKLAR
jgi:hypothetical protein